MQIILLAAVAHHRVIGVNNTLPWHLPEDLRRFKSLTTGHTVVMGRKTFDSIVARLGKPLPNRHSVVLTRDQSWRAPQGFESQVQVIHDVQAIRALSDEFVYVIGGAEVYAQTLALATSLDITEIDLEVTGDAFFPEIDLTKWARNASSPMVSERDGLSYAFVRYTRNPDPKV